MPAFNAERFIDLALGSLTEQTYPHWRVVVVDDGSRDTTSDIVDNRVRGDGRIRLVRQANAGTSAARNAGLAVLGDTDAQYVSFLDSDDLLLPHAFSELVQALAPRPDAVGAAGLAEYIDTDGVALGGNSHSDLQRNRHTFGPHSGAATEGVGGGVGGGPAGPARRLITSQFGRPLRNSEDTTFDSLAIRGTIWPPATALVRMDAAVAVGGYDESLKYMEDWDFFLRLARKGPFVFVDRQVAWYRRHTGNRGQIGVAGGAWDPGYHAALQTVRYRAWLTGADSVVERRVLERAHRRYAMTLLKDQAKRIVSDLSSRRRKSLVQDMARLRYSMQLLGAKHPTEPNGEQLRSLT